MTLMYALRGVSVSGTSAYPVRQPPSAPLRLQPMTSDLLPDLQPDVLLGAYAQGLFPMDDEAGNLRWFRPQLRGILPLDDGFHVGKNLRKRVRQQRWDVTTDRDFEAVMSACAEGREMWISDRMIAAYARLHELGWAHSVEVWQDGELIGGLYGVTIGGAFCGESMFSRSTDASKVALVWLVGTLRRQGFRLLDTQWTTDHLVQFGAYEVEADRYEQLLARALTIRPAWPHTLAYPDTVVPLSS